MTQTQYKLNRRILAIIVSVTLVCGLILIPTVYADSELENSKNEIKYNDNNGYLITTDKDNAEDSVELVVLSGGGGGAPPIVLTPVDINYLPNPGTANLGVLPDADNRVKAIFYHHSDKTPIFIDARRADEIASGGFINGSIFLSIASIDSRVDTINHLIQTGVLPPPTTTAYKFLVYCLGGVRATPAAEALIYVGFEYVWNVGQIAQIPARSSGMISLSTAANELHTAVSPLQVRDMIADDQPLFVLDLRDEAAFNLGSVSGAISIPTGSGTASGNAATNPINRISRWVTETFGGLSASNNARVVIFSQDGAIFDGAPPAHTAATNSPATNAANALRHMGFTNVHHMTGGFNAWTAVSSVLDARELWWTYKNSTAVHGQDFFTIDVRRPADEFAFGHVLGADNVNWQAATGATQAPTFVASVLDLVDGDLDVAIFVYCLGGVRSLATRNALIAAGFTNVHDIGGIQNWPATGTITNIGLDADRFPIVGRRPVATPPTITLSGSQITWDATAGQYYNVLVFNSAADAERKANAVNAITLVAADAVAIHYFATSPFNLQNFNLPAGNYWIIVRAVSSDITPLAWNAFESLSNEVGIFTVRRPSGSGGGTIATPPAQQEEIEEPQTPLADYEITQRFTDVNAGQWFYDAVAFVVENNTMLGVSADTFAPNANFNRAMAATVLFRMAGADAVFTSIFDDVVGNQWYSDAVAWAAANGIVMGIGENLFDPYANVTREQLVTMLFRFAAFMEYDMSTSELSGFVDMDEISDWAKDAMSWAVHHEIIQGANNQLNPQETATRAEVATILMRITLMMQD